MLTRSITLRTASCWRLVISTCPRFTSRLSANSFRRSRIAVITVVFPVPGGPWIIAISGVFRAIDIASFWVAVASCLNIFLATACVSAGICFLRFHSIGNTPASSIKVSSLPPIICPRCGLAEIPFSILSRACLRRMICFLSPVSSKIRFPVRFILAS